MPEWTPEQASRVGIDLATDVLGFVMVLAVGLLVLALLREVTR